MQLKQIGSYYDNNLRPKAIIEIGSASSRLIIGNVLDNEIDVIYDAKDKYKLGLSEMSKNKKFDGIIEIVKKYIKTIKQSGVDQWNIVVSSGAITTDLEKAVNDYGNLIVLDGNQEAENISFAVKNSFHDIKPGTVIVDIGSSLETIRIGKEKDEITPQGKIGFLSLLKEISPDTKVWSARAIRKKTRIKLRKYFRQSVSGLILSGAMPLFLFKALGLYDSNEMNLHGKKITNEQLKEAKKIFESFDGLKAKIGEYEFDRNWMLAFIVQLQTIMQMAKLNEVTVSVMELRHGALMRY